MPDSPWLTPSGVPGGARLPSTTRTLVLGGIAAALIVFGASIGSGIEDIGLTGTAFTVIWKIVW